MKVNRTITIEKELWDKLKVYAAQKKKTISTIIEELVKNLLCGEVKK
ncbi:hypothetical protein J7L49_03735 [Candidatus Bathyarchaeota archaeon]|nr:hypothetical protein [Candidatus Bathyarchaeota archaeon]